MVHELVQRKFFTKTTFRFSDSKLCCQVSKYGNGDEFDIPFEQISGEKYSKTKLSDVILYTALSFGVAIFFLGPLFYNINKTYLYVFILATVIIVVILMFYLWKKRDKFWKLKLSNGGYLYFHQNIPNSKVVDDFLNDLILARNTYLRKNYAYVDKNLNYENQLQNFRWLKSINVISEAEFDTIYEELKQTVNPNKPNIGFGK